MNDLAHRELRGIMPTTEEEFNWDHFHRDTRALSLEARGAWWDCLYQMRLSQTRGRIVMPLASIATMFGSTKKQTLSILKEIELLKVGDVESDSKMVFTITNRRMFRRSERVSPYFAKVLTNVKPTPEICGTGIDSSSSSSSSSSKDKSLDKEKKKKKSLVSATRIPDPFPLTDLMTAWAKENLPALRLVAAHDKFVEYWTNNVTAKAFKVNWQITWQNGMKLALKWQLENESKVEVGKWDGEERAVEVCICPRCGSDICLGGKKCDEMAQARLAA